MLVCITALGYQARYLEIDASAETLLLEDDKDLEYTRLINQRYHTPDFLVISYTPQKDLLAEESLETIREMSRDLEKLELVESVTSILNVPLLESPPKPLAELLEDVPTLESADIDMKLAREEFLNSPIYRDNLVSADFKTTGLIVNLHNDQRNRELRDQRDMLRRREKSGTLSAEETAQYEYVKIEYKAHRDMMRSVESENIDQIRAILNKYRGNDQLFLGGPVSYTHLTLPTKA